MDMLSVNNKNSSNQFGWYDRLWVIPVLFVLTLSSGVVQAEMSVFPLFVDISHDDKYSKDVEISNKGTDPIYVKVEVLEVKKPGTEHEERVAVQKLSGKALIAVPDKLAIPPNSKKNVRLTSLGTATTTDLVYRITYTPAHGELKAKTSGIKILVAYQGLVIIRPPKPVANISAERKGDVIIFRNTGNSNALLKNGLQCHPDNKEQCESLDTKRLYAGNVWEYKPPFNGPVTFEVDYGDNVETRVFGKK